MNFQSFNIKNYIRKMFPIFLTFCWFLLNASFVNAKAFSPYTGDKSGVKIDKEYEKLVQRFNLEENGMGVQQDNTFDKMDKAINQMEKSLQNLRESFEKIQGEASTTQIRGKRGNGSRHTGMHGMRHGRRGGMRHGRMHGGYSMDGLASECPQPRKTMKVPEPLYSQTNPLKNTPDNIEMGRHLFQLEVQPSCTMCHGSGDGRGIMAGTLNPPPRNFSCKETMQDIPDGQLFGIITNGSEGSGMPAFLDLNDDQIWKLILYIRTLAK